MRVPGFADARARLLGLVRRGPRTVLWTEATHGFGNVLYGWLQAHVRQRRAEECTALLTPTGLRWLPELGGRADRLVTARSEVGLTDRREIGDFFDFGIHYGAGDLDAFLDEVVLPAPLSAPAGATVVGPDDVVIVVRRGDYWSVPAFRARYAFDTDAYLREALELQQRAGGPVSGIHVVSDGIPWCRANLGWLQETVPTLSFAAGDQTPRDHFATMVGARRLILTNTSFGYWGGYASGRRHRGDRPVVVAPRFHARGLTRGTRAPQLLPGWVVVESIPGGWVEPPVGTG
jgi:hypothetical protein